MEWFLTLLIIFCTIFNSISHPSNLETNTWDRSSNTKKHIQIRDLRNVQENEEFSVSALTTVNSQNVAGEESDTEFLCESVFFTVYPKQGITVNNVTKYIVNTDTNRQSIAYRKCVTDESKNKGMCSRLRHFLPNITSECTQKYSKMPLLTYDQDSNETKIDYFYIPSCCMCSIKQIK